MLVRCLYASKAVEPGSHDVLESILSQSCRNNPALGITGLLCVSSSVFVQVIEGSRDAVCELFNSIVRDERNANVRLLLFEEISKRRFENWTMGQVKIEGVNAALILKYSENAELDPFSCSGHSIMALLEELVESGAIATRVPLFPVSTYGPDLRL